MQMVISIIQIHSEGKQKYKIYYIHQSFSDFHYFQTYVSARAVVVTSLNLSKASVWEVELLRPVVDGQAAGSQDVRTYDDPQVLSR